MSFKAYTSRPNKTGKAQIFWDYCRKQMGHDPAEIFFSRDHSYGPRWVGRDPELGSGFREYGAKCSMRFVEAESGDRIFDI